MLADLYEIQQEEEPRTIPERKLGELIVAIA
jgi:hypothetical protein